MKVTAEKILWAIRAIIYKPFYGKVGSPSYIGMPTYIEGRKNIYIGNKVRIFPHVRMETHNDGKITIKDNVYIGQNCHITSGKLDLVIGEGTEVMANVCITNIDHNYEKINTPVLEQGVSYKKTIIGENCFIGHNSVIQAGVTLGNHIIVGANSVVCRGGYSSNCVLVGAPARIVKTYNEQTMKWEKVK